MDRKKLGIDAFTKGYNCCQSVVFAFKNDLPLDENTLLDLSVGFGAGFARTRNICGTVSAMGIVTGLLTKKTGDVKKDKDESYKLLQDLINQFIDENSTIICGELLKNLRVSTTPISEERTKEYYKVRPCAKFVEDSIEILEKYLIENGLINE